MRSFPNSRFQLFLAVFTFIAIAPAAPNGFANSGNAAIVVAFDDHGNPAVRRDHSMNVEASLSADTLSFNRWDVRLILSKNGAKNEIEFINQGFNVSSWPEQRILGIAKFTEKDRELLGDIMTFSLRHVREKEAELQKNPDPNDPFQQCVDFEI